MTYLYNDKKLKIYRKNLRNNMPEPEQLLWYHLRSKNLKGYKFRRQYSSGKYILDFYCPKVRLGIEIDGDSHYIDSKAKAYDKNRETFLESENIKILRFTNTEVRENIEAVVDKILEQLP